MDIIDDTEDLYRMNQKLNQEARRVLNKIDQLELIDSGESVILFFKQLPPASEKKYYQSVVNMHIYVYLCCCYLLYVFCAYFLTTVLRLSSCYFDCPMTFFS